MRVNCGKREGTDKIIEKVCLLTNTDKSNEHFLLAPKEQLAAVKDMRSHGYIPFGNRHSPPNLHQDRLMKINGLLTIKP